MPKDLIRPLSKNEISAARDIVFVAKIQSKWEIKRLIRQINKDTLLVALNIDQSLKGLPNSNLWIEDLKQIRQLSRHLFSHLENAKIRLDTVDASVLVYNELNRLNQLPLGLRKLYNTNNYDLMVKKYLVSFIYDIIHINTFINKYKKYNNNIKFIPSHYFVNNHQYLINILAEIRPEYVNELKRSIDSSNIKYLFKHFFQKVKSIVAVVILPLIILSSIRRVLKAGQKKKYKYCHRVYSSGIKISDAESLDWFIYESNIPKTDILFVEESKINKKSRDTFIKNNYRIVDFTGLKPFRDVNINFIKNLFKISFKVSPLIIKDLVNKVNKTNLYDRFTLILYYDYFRWSAFQSRYETDYYLTYNDYSLSHITRNVILSLNGSSKTWLYHHSLSSYSLLFPQTNMSIDLQNSFSFYDRVFLPIDGIKYSYLRAHAKIDHFEHNGPIIMMTKCNISPWGLMEDVQVTVNDKIISFFSAGTGVNVLNTFENLIGFYKMIIELRNSGEFSEYRFILKNKKRVPEQVMGMFSELMSMENVFELPEGIASAQLISISNLVVSMSFTGPSTEALFQGKPAFYFDSKGEFASSQYAKVPRYVVSSSDNIPAVCKYWLRQSERSIFNHCRFFLRSVQDGYGNDNFIKHLMQAQ